MYDFSTNTSEYMIPGFTPNESAFAVRAVYNAVAPLAKSAGLADEEIVKGIRTTEFPTLSKSVVGGLQHVVSVDNGANYAEMWRSGGNWYAVTGAVDKVEKAIVDWESINLIDGVTKGMSVKQAIPRFLEAINKSDCGCGSK